MTAGSIAIDVTDATFQQTVLEESRRRPVVVDFWAPWCGPCKVLGPIIERVAAEHDGQVVLAKLNTDENPRTAMAFKIQGIPAVKAFRDGRVVAEFTGALPEPQVRRFFEQLLPSAADRLAAEGARIAASGDLATAESKFRDALAHDSNHPEAILGLARILLGRDDANSKEEAERLLSRVPNDRRAKVLRHTLFLESFAAKNDPAELERDAKANPTDPRARYRHGVMLAAQGRYEDALDELLESVRLDRRFADEAARKAVLAVFDILGMQSPVTREYQRRLSQILF